MDPYIKGKLTDQKKGEKNSSNSQMASCLNAIQKSTSRAHLSENGSLWRSDVIFLQVVSTQYPQSV